MRRPYRTIVLLSAVGCFAGLSVADEAPKPPDKGPKPVKSSGLVNIVGAYCKEKGLRIDVKGRETPGHVMILLVGGASYAAADKTIKAANTALKALDVWTGSQGVFVGPEEDKGFHYVIVLFQGSDQFGAFVDWLREKKVLPAPGGQEDLIKKLDNFNGPRSIVTTAEKAAFSPENFAIHSVTGCAISAFFSERGEASLPNWVVCGLSADLQRLVTKKVLWSSISYEMSSPDMRGSWSMDVASMIRRRDKQLRPARMVMNFSLISLPGKHYKLMWSLNTMMVRSAGNMKGRNNKYLMLLEEIAKGTSSEDAVKKVYGIKDPQLTQRWFGWAQSQR